MRRFASAFLFLLTSNLGLCADWKTVSLTDDSIIEIDTTSIASRDKYRKAWLRTTYYSQQPVTRGHPAYDPDTFAKSFNQTKALWYFHCSELTTSTLNLIYYLVKDDKSEVIGSWSVPFEKASFYDVAPETVGEEIFKFVCKKPGASKP